MIPRVLAVLFVVTTTLLAVQSQPPPPGGREKIQTPDGKSDTGRKDPTVAPATTTDPIVGPESPVTNLPTQQPSNYTHNKYGTSTDEGWDIPSAVNAAAAVVITFLTGALVYVAWKQRETSELQRSIMDQQRITTEMMLVTNKKIERAYVDIGDWQLKKFADRSPDHLVCRLKNGGHTPAYHVCIAMDWDICKTFPANAVYKRPSKDAPTFMLNGGSEHQTSAAAPVPSKEQSEAFLTGDSALFLWGQIRYRDAFGAIHHRRYSICAERGGAMWYASDGMKNDEDQAEA